MNIADAIYRTTYRLEQADNQKEWDEMCAAEEHLKFLIAEKYKKDPCIDKQIAVLRESALTCGFIGGLIYAREYRGK